MGVEIPQVRLPDHPPMEMPYGFTQSSYYLDEAYVAFHKVRSLTARLTQVEISVYRLTEEIRKTQKRANALKNIVIPEYEATARWISDVLEEREREDFIRLKMIKKGAGNLME
jgi:V/A-type H+-transporting ATPase subunit D